MADSNEPSEEDKAAIRKAMARERNRRYRERNPDAGRLYYQKNRERILRRCKEYRQKHADARRAANQRYYELHKEKISAWKKSDAGRESQKRTSRRISSDPLKAEARRIKDKEYSKAYRMRHPDRRKASCDKYRKNNKQKQREAFQRRVIKNLVLYRKSAAERTRKWRARFTEKHGVAFSTMRARSDKSFALVKNIRNRVDLAIKAHHATKKDRTLVLVGCTVASLVKYIESKFLDGMSWDNRSRWHIDHIIPISRFDLRDPAQQAAAFHYTNLQPLWAEDNLRKSDKVHGQHLLGFAYAAKIADAVGKASKKRPKRARRHKPD